MATDKSGTPSVLIKFPSPHHFPKLHLPDTSIYRAILRSTLEVSRTELIATLTECTMYVYIFLRDAKRFTEGQFYTHETFPNPFEQSEKCVSFPK